MSMSGFLFLIVGASGVGKDTVLAGVRDQLQNFDQFVFAQRTITRAPGLGGEDCVCVTREQFDDLNASDAFFATWEAHGLCYGLPQALLAELRSGKHVFANVSRSVIGQLGRVWKNVVVVNITASPDTIADRLRQRGRESEDDIHRRLQRQPAALPTDMDVLTVTNDGSIKDAVGQFSDVVFAKIPETLRLRKVAIDTWHDCICYLNEQCSTYDASSYLGPNKLEIFNANGDVRAKLNVVSDSLLVAPDEIGLSLAGFEKLGLEEGAPVILQRTPSPESKTALRTKVAGKTLSRDQVELIVRDIALDRYNRREISAFLCAAAENLNLEELEALTVARANHSQKMCWPFDSVVDKHSMGGVPGSRITMIVIPIVAAHGMIIPKTSSRAITSASGTADAMEVVARVDLTSDEVQDVVSRTGACIAWNGRINHSSADDVMNSIVRPLGIDSQMWSVASILSKKIAAGSTHVIVDIPFGSETKTPSLDDAKRLAALFEDVGQRVGLNIRVKPTDGSMPIGRGIGPALEVRDVYAVLNRLPNAPRGLRDKALDFAGDILQWDDKVGRGQGRAVAEKLLDDGSALQALERIIDAQGRKDDPIGPSTTISEVRAKRSGLVTGVRGKFLSGTARRAGAPFEKSAGVDLVVGPGDSVSEGDVLMLIHGATQMELSSALQYEADNEALIIE